MDVERTALRLIPLLYDAALDEDRMPAFHDALTAEMGDFRAGIALRLPGFGGRSLICASDDDPEAIRSYTDYFHAMDPEVGALATAPIGEFVETTRFLPLEAHAKSEFYNDFVLRFQHAWAPHFAVPLALENGRPVASFFIRNRRPDCSGLDAAQSRLAQVLVPHVITARRIWAALDDASARSRGLCEALDHMQMGVLVVDAQRRIAWTNRQACQILASRDGLRIEAGELEADSRTRTAILQREITAATTMETGDEVAEGGTICVPRPSGRRPLEIMVAPIPGRSSLAIRESGGTALVFVSEPDAELPGEDEVLRALYGLTPAEVRFARLLAADLSLAEAAEQAGITLQTARHRLKALFEKTNTHRQASLVRLLVRGPASLARRVG
jgi:DNA-binding CsgD family transcriptional regulator/PAS domain-containing protein